MTVRYITGDCRDVLPTLPADLFDCCLTSPPYWRQRDYGVDGQIGLEKTPEEYVEKMVAVFSEVRRVLRLDGTLWLNVGDKWASGGNGGGGSFMASRQDAWAHAKDAKGWRSPPVGYKDKDLVGVPWMLAFALRADGWFLRQCNIWAKPNCLSGGTWLYAKTANSVGPMMLKDLVRLKPDTVSLWNGNSWTRVVSWTPSPRPEKAIELVLRSGERIGCTPDHLWPTASGEKSAGDLRPGDRLIHCGLPQTSAEAPWLTSDAFWFAGLFLAEGHVAKDGAVVISGHVRECARVDRLSDLVAHYGGSFAVHGTGGNSQAVVVYSPALTAVLRTLVAGDSAHTKRLTATAWASSKRALVSLAEGYLHGDGAEDGARIRLGFCRNYALERDLRSLAARLGAIITLRPSVSRNQAGKDFSSFRGEWRWSRSGHLNEKDRGEIVAIRGSRARRFWDVSVEDSPHLFALSSGVLTHNCMPESVRDRSTMSHEYVFQLSRSNQYFYDDAARTPAAPSSETVAKQRANGARLRSVWWIAPAQEKAAHYAVMPSALAEICILRGSRVGGAVLDPFGGFGTTGLVADRLGRRATLIDLNGSYRDMGIERIHNDAPLFAETEA